MDGISPRWISGLLRDGRERPHLSGLHASSVGFKRITLETLRRYMSVHVENDGRELGRSAISLSDQIEKVFIFFPLRSPLSLSLSPLIHSRLFCLLLILKPKDFGDDVERRRRNERRPWSGDGPLNPDMSAHFHKGAVRAMRLRSHSLWTAGRDSQVTFTLFNEI